MSDLTDKARRRLVADLQSARTLADGLSAKTDAARVKLHDQIMRARDAGMTIPAISEALGWSIANTNRVIAVAKKRALRASK